MRRRQEDTTADRGGGTGDGGDGVMSVWKSTGNRDVLQIIQTPDHCDGKWIDRSHIKPLEVAEYMVPPVQYLGEGGSGLQNVRSFLPGSGPKSYIIWSRYVSGDPMYGTSPEDLPS